MVPLGSLGLLVKESSLFVFRHLAEEGMRVQLG